MKDDWRVLKRDGQTVARDTYAGWFVCPDGIGCRVLKGGLRLSQKGQGLKAERGDDDDDDAR